MRTPCDPTGASKLNTFIPVPATALIVTSAHRAALTGALKLNALSIVPMRPLTVTPTTEAITDCGIAERQLSTVRHVDHVRV